MATDPHRINRRIKLRDLDTLVAVAAAGGFRKAAEHLHLSQPAVSKAVAALEDTVGYPLVYRSKAGVEITPYGAALLKRAGSIFDDLQQGVRELEEIADPEAGEIRFGCSEPIMAGIMAMAMERMARLYPRVRFSAESSGAATTLVRALQDREYDFVLGRPHGLVLDRGIRTEPLFHEKLQVVVGVNNPRAARRKLTLAELANDTWILAGNEHHNSDSPLAQSFQAAGLPQPLPRIVTGSLNVRVTLLNAGPFITVMPHSFLRFGAQSGRLKVLPIELGLWQIPTSIFTLHNRAQNPVVTRFLDILRELARQLPQRMLR